MLVMPVLRDVAPGRDEDVPEARNMIEKARRAAGLARFLDHVAGFGHVFVAKKSSPWAKPCALMKRISLASRL